MRILKLILFTITLALACSVSYGQAPTKVSFGGTRPIDTAWAGRHLRIDSTVRFLKYSTADATKYLRINASGFLELGTPAGGGGNADSATFFTNYRADTMRSNIYGQLGTKGTGTVTNVSTGFGMLGGPITITGTVRVDSNAVLTVARGYKVSDSVAGSRVPYTGATQTVDLGNQNLITDTITGTGSGGLHLHGSSSNSGIEIANFGQVRMDYYPIANSGDSVLTTNSNGYIQVYNLRGNYQKLSDTSTWDATRSWVNGRGFGTGSVTSVGSGFGLTGGAITTTGTLRVDTANVPTQYRVDTTAFNALTRINTKGTVSSVALANGFGLSVSGSPVTGTGTITATVDTTKVATKADVNAKGSGTVTSIQVVGGTGATVTPTTAVTTSGVYTVTPEVSSATYNTLTNKRITYRTGGAASYTTSVTIPADSVNIFIITAQAGALLFNAPSGTPTEGQVLEIVIKDNNTARALTWNAIFDWSPPSTTILGKWKKMFFQWNATTSKWNFMRQVDEP
mgnify:CR=1 FL=1